MDEMPQIEVHEIGHLGLISAVLKKFKIAEKINLLLPKKNNNQKINHAEFILAMIYCCECEHGRFSCSGCYLRVQLRNVR